MQTTDNYGLKKPEASDFYNVEDFNENMDKIDAAIDNALSDAKDYTDDELEDYLPLTGGDVSGNIKLSTNNKALYGVLNDGTTQKLLIGMDNENRCTVAPTTDTVLIGKYPNSTTVVNGELDVTSETDITNRLNVIYSGTQLKIAKEATGIPFFIRNDGTDTFFMVGDAGADKYNDLRPFTITNSTGTVNINNMFFVDPVNWQIVFNGNIINTSNNKALNGRTTTNATHWVIGIDDSDRCVIAPTLNTVLIGKSSTSTTCVNGTLFTYGSIYPGAEDAYTIGYSNRRWKQFFAMTSTISTSDRNLKKDIDDLDDRYDAFFNLLASKSFKFIEGESGRTHIGFISQDVEDALHQVGLTALDFAGFCKDVKQKEVVIKEAKYDEKGNVVSQAVTEWVDDLDEDGNVQYIYSLRYEEFIAINTNQIQKLKAKVIMLEQIK